MVDPKARMEVHENDTNEELSILLNVNTPAEKRYPVRVLRVSGDGKLAVFKVDLTEKIPALELGNDEDLVETQQLYIFGYPFGLTERKKNIRIKDGPVSFSTSVARVTALRKDGDVLTAIQMDGQLNPGNSGGPVLDENGKVIGLAASIDRGTGVNFAMPIAALKRMMLSPVVTIALPPIAFEERFQPAKFTISTHSLKPLVNDNVTLEITSLGQTRSEKAVKVKDGEYQVSLAPMAPRAFNANDMVAATIDLESGQVRGLIKDLQIPISGKSRPLSQTSLVERKTAGGPLFIDGMSSGGPVPELAKLKVQVGGETLSLDGEKIRRLVVTSPVNDRLPVTYKAVATAGAAQTAIEGRIPLAAPFTTGDFPASPSPSSDLPSPRPAVGAVRNFPISHTKAIALGNEGRALVFRFMKPSRLEVFDVVEMKMRGTIELAEDLPFFAVGKTHVLVCLAEKKVIQRYSLETLKLEKTMPLPEGKVIAMTMGSHATGSALLVAVGATNEATFYLIDAEKMTVSATERDEKLFPDAKQTIMCLRASADGSTYAFSVNMKGFHVVTYKNGHLAFFHRPDFKSPLGLLVPNADGSRIFADESGVFSPEMVPLVRPGASRRVYLPSTQGDWFLTVGEAAPDPSYIMYLPTSPGSPFFTAAGSSGRNNLGAIRVVFHSGTSSQPIAYFPGKIDELESYAGSWRTTSGWPSITADQRCIYLPDLQRLVTISSDNERFSVREFDLQKLLLEQGVDYLYLTAVPPPVAPSRRLNFPLTAASNVGGITYALRSGPPGLKVSQEGVIDWTAPAKPVRESVTILLKNLAGMQVEQTFQLIVSP
jgi:hypothetical protein